MSWTRFLRLLKNLPERHLSALEWFDNHAGQVVGWPGQLPDGTFLAAKAKGIYKPAWSKYALSVRRSLAGPYPDREIEISADGSWDFRYFQEDLDPTQRDLQFTNKGLVECWKDVVPVGVIIQKSGKPNPRYLIMGLAIVAGWDEGYFTLEGSSAVVHLDVSIAADSSIVTVRADALAGQFDAALAAEDQRRETIRNVVIRQGQQGFRRTLLGAYEGRCALTGYDADGALEAVHIMPYRGPVTNHPSNGLLLRADLHNLFDLGLIAIDSKTHAVMLSRELRETKYFPELKGGSLRSPSELALAPSPAALDEHRLKFGILME